MDFILWVWSIHAAVSTALAAPFAVYTWEKSRWTRYDLLALVIPFAVWSYLLIVFADRKEFGNFIECFYLTGAMPIAAMFRAWIGRRASSGVSTACTVGGLTAVVVAIFFLTPAIPK